MNPIIKYVLSAGVATLSTSTYLEHKMKKGDDVTQAPPDNVTIIIPSYNEEIYIEETLKSLRNQTVAKMYPEYFEYILVDSQSSDKTVELAKPYVDKIIIAPRGKLTARIKATDAAKGNIVVSVDSDSIYLPTWLNALLKPFQEPGVAGVVGSTIQNSFIPKPIYVVGMTFERFITRPTQMIGRNSAFWKHLFYLSGKFDTTVNQFDVKQMLQEEERDFGNRLSKHGKIVFRLNATCIHLGGIKGDCRAGFVSDNICSKYGFGIERFG